MLYHWYELGHVAVGPARAAADSWRLFFSNPFNPLAHTALGRHATAASEVFERTTRRYAKPEFGITSTRVNGRDIAVSEEEVWKRPFCRLVHFRRDGGLGLDTRDPRVLLVAPMSGHYATLLRGTVEALLPDHEVFITDWQDARGVPVSAGAFSLDDYIDYIREMLTLFGGDVHVFAVCQPSVPVLAATALMEEDGDPATPRSLIMAGGPVDPRVSPTEVNRIAERRGTNWFRNNVITHVPWPCAGAGRLVYPGFLQLTGFMSMNLHRHARAHKELFLNLVHGDGDSAEKHREFYDEYLAVMDLTAEFYLDTIDAVFVRHLLPKGEMLHRGRRVDLTQIRNTALFTIEGENDDITGRGQCRAALDLCAGLPDERKHHYECGGVGHYGIFNGSRFRAEIASRIAQFIRTNDPRMRNIPVTRAPFCQASTVAPVMNRAEAQARACGHEHEISDVAFTFAPANDTGPVGQTRHVAPDGQANTSTPSRTEQPKSTPFRMLALAGRLVIDGVFNMSEGARASTGRARSR